MTKRKLNAIYGYCNLRQYPRTFHHQLSLITAANLDHLSAKNIAKIMELTYNSYSNGHTHGYKDKTT